MDSYEVQTCTLPLNGVANTTDDQVLALTNFELLIPRSMKNPEMDDHDLLDHMRHFESHVLGFILHRCDPYYFHSSKWDFYVNIMDTTVINWLSKSKVNHATYVDGNFVFKLRCLSFLRDTLYIPPGYNLRITSFEGSPVNTTLSIKFAQKAINIKTIPRNLPTTNHSICAIAKATSFIKEVSIVDIRLAFTDVFIVLQSSAEVKGMTLITLSGQRVSMPSDEFTKMRNINGKGIGYIIPLGDMSTEVVRRSFKQQVIEPSDISYGQYQDGVTLHIYFRSHEEYYFKPFRVSTLSIDTYSTRCFAKYHQYLNTMAQAEFECI